MIEDRDHILPSHIEATVAAIARLHEQHRQGATSVQRTVDAATRFVGRPRFAGLVALLMVVWVSANAWLLALRLPPLDPPPFNALQGVCEIAALFIAIFILITERRENELSELREQLTLELAMLSEQKAAKTIALLEELRRDLPNVRNRHDPEAEDLAQAADPEAVLEALRETQAEDASPAPDE